MRPEPEQRIGQAMKDVYPWVFPRFSSADPVVPATLCDRCGTWITNDSLYYHMRVVFCGEDVFCYHAACYRKAMKDG